MQGLRLGRVGANTKLMIIGASGGVGTFAVQLAKAMGAKVTAVCSAKNETLARELGAEQVIDYRQVDITKLKDSYDVVFDITSFHSQATCTKLLKPTGIFISTGGNASAIVRSIRDRLLFKAQQSKNVWVKPNKTDLQRLAKYIEQGKVKPIIDSQHSFDHINEAYLRNKSGHCAGKVVVKIK